MPLDPFSTPLLVLYDSLRVYTAGVTIIVAIGLATQFVHRQPTLSGHLQVARRLMLSAMALILLSDSGAGLTRLGSEDTIGSRLVAIAIGVTLLLVWMVFESKARKDESP